MVEARIPCFTESREVPYSYSTFPRFHVFLRPVFLHRLFLLASGLLFLPGCQTTSRWGASDDAEWSGRVGTARYADAVSALGQPRKTLSLPGGETKARWLASTLSVNPEPGSMQDYSVQRTEERPLWRDMLFSAEGVLLRAWTSDQRDLADSQPP
jgi:hypothetical protein